MMNLNPPATNTVRQFDMNTGVARDIQKPVATQDPPVRRHRLAPEVEDGIVQQQLAQPRRQEEIERKKAAIAVSTADELAQAQQWLRLAGAGALAQVVVRLARIERALEAMESKIDDTGN
jgi:hypothetical protein